MKQQPPAKTPPPPSSSDEITRLMSEAAEGRREATEKLFSCIYEQLRSIGAQKMAAERQDHTLDATAFVHEAYLRLMGNSDARSANRAHFFHAAAEAMRRVLVEHAREERMRRIILFRCLRIGAIALLLAAAGMSCSSDRDRPIGEIKRPASDRVESASPVAIAAYEGNTALVARLVQEKHDRLADQSFGARMTLLAVAASQGHADTVSFLLRAGLNPNIPDQSGATPLSFAALSSGSAETVEVLLKGGANPNAPNIQGDTPLHYAATSGKLDVAKLLVAGGADPNIRDLKGLTAGETASGDGFPELAKYLKNLERPATKDAKTSADGLPEPPEMERRDIMGPTRDVPLVMPNLPLVVPELPDDFIERKGK